MEQIKSLVTENNFASTLQEQQRALGSLSFTYRTLKENYESLESEMETLKREKAQLKQALNKTRADLQNNAQKIASTTATVTELEEIVIDNSAKRGVSKEDFQQLSKKIDELEADLANDSSSKSFNELAEEIVDLKQKCSFLLEKDKANDSSFELISQQADSMAKRQVSF
jgi:chromosome segregation ATPase